MAVRLTERELQHRLWCRIRNGFQILLPNFTPRNWWECDLFGVTKAGYFHEFEIKLTVADFCADADKRMTESRWREGLPPLERFKCADLSAGSTKGPVHFWYCAPRHVLDQVEVPHWAGIQVLEPNWHWFKVLRKPPRLHGTKVDSKIVELAYSSCYFRFWVERERVVKLQRKQVG